MKILFHIEEIPEDLKVVNGSWILKKLVDCYKQKAKKNLTEVKKEIGRGIIKNEKNFRLYLNNQRNAPFVIYKR